MQTKAHKCVVSVANFRPPFKISHREVEIEAKPEVDIKSAQLDEIAPVHPDAWLVAAAKLMPETKRDLAAFKEFIGRASCTQIDRWWAAIEAGKASTDLPNLRVPSDSVPPPRVWADKNPEADRRLKAARAAITELSEAMAIPIENLLTPDSLRRVAWRPPAEVTLESIRAALAETGARTWQLDATAQLIHSAFVEALQSPEEADDTES